ncbi:translation initiation factor IF-2 subunit beta [Nanobdella aerobiophila]|uniref:Translation initiation factor IF-2 subunit beta n=1 Tax=Nanobdella aerobiophila TaxID=2586965 RepID=A0A915S9R1_9ARCH|nr:hypothetical protein [Nanobdella aerobiophila]BBL45202.1 translation initiation factor IF-2 subunit beta [Nanobdella aerobiophila]
MIPKYEDMLDEVYEKLSKIKVSHGSSLGLISVPLPKVNYIGKWTSIENTKNILEVINRDITLLALFFQKEFNVPSKIEDNKIILQKKIDFEKIKDKLDKFVDIFVRCPVCKKLDTKIEKRERIYYIKCMVCGAESPIIYYIR